MNVLEKVTVSALTALLLTGAYVLGTYHYDHLDVNRNGVADLVDLSVLAYEINAQGE